MEKKITLILFACFFVSIMFSQSIAPTVIATDGGYSQVSQGSLAWTIGEPISETYTGTAKITTMGFHQPEVLKLTTLIKEDGEEKNFLVYPNPIQNNLTLNFENIEAGNFHIELIDGLGRFLLISDAEISDTQKTYELSLNEVSSGNYYLKVNGANLNKTIKINKIQ